MFRLVAAAVISMILTGCASVNQMAFDKTATTVDTSSRSVVLMTIDVSRSDESRYVPNPLVVKFTKENAQSSEDRQNYKLSRYTDSVEQDGHILYLTRMALPPGKYRLGDIFGNANAFPFNGFFSVPVYADLIVKPNSITYVGRVSAKLRPRQEGEFRAGPLFPLIDQAATGVSSGTWDVTTNDMSKEDLALFRSNYPVLSAANIEIAPLPPFDRALAQRLWEGAQPKDAKEQTTPVATQAAAK